MSICFDVCFFKEERSRNGRIKRSRMEFKKTQTSKVGKIFTQCTGFEREGKQRKLERNLDEHERISYSTYGKNMRKRRNWQRQKGREERNSKSRIVEDVCKRTKKQLKNTSLTSKLYTIWNCNSFSAKIPYIYKFPEFFSKLLYYSISQESLTSTDVAHLTNYFNNCRQQNFLEV